MDAFAPLMAWLASLPLDWRWVPHRSTIFPILMALFCGGIFLFERWRRRAPLPQQVWYPPRGPAGPQLATTAGGALPPAHAAMGEGRWGDALHALAAEELTPDDAWTPFHMGLACDELGAWREAEACYRATLEIAAGHRDAAFNLARLLAATGRVPEAVSAYRRLLADVPDDVDALYNLGHLYFGLKLYPQAHQAWKAAKLQDPAARDVRMNLRLLARLRRSQGAQKKAPVQEGREPGVTA